MARTSVTRLARTAVRGLATRSVASSSIRRFAFSRPQVVESRPAFRSSFSTSQRLAEPLCADDLKNAQPANITDEEFHKLADDYIEKLLGEYEAIQDQRTDIDVEYSVRGNLLR